MTSEDWLMGIILSLVVGFGVPTLLMWLAGADFPLHRGVGLVSWFLVCCFIFFASMKSWVDTFRKEE